MEKEKKIKSKSYLIIRYEPTAKNGEKFLEKDNASGTAVLYRAFSSAKEPLTVAEAYEACKGKMESNAAWERLSKYAIISALHKNGFLKKTERREEVEAKPNGSAKRAQRAATAQASRTKTPRKPRAEAPAAEKAATPAEATA